MSLRRGQPVSELVWHISAMYLYAGITDSAPVAEVGCADSDVSTPHVGCWVKFRRTVGLVWLKSRATVKQLLRCAVLTSLIDLQSLQKAPP